MEIIDPEILYVSGLVAAIFRSPTWVSPISKFVDENCFTFEDQDENKLEYTLIHNAFKLLIDELLEAHLQELAVTPEQFERFCHHGMGGSNEFHKELVEQLLSVDDFLIFKAMMVKRNAQLYRQALDMFGFASPDPSAPEADFHEQAPVAPPPTEAQSAEDEEARKRLEAAELEAEKLELQRRCVEAELQLAMALSAQLKKRLELMEALSAVLEALADMKEGAESEAIAAELMADAPVQVQPLYMVTDADEEAQAAEAAAQRERAEHAVAASRRAAAAREAEARAAAAKPQPTEEERSRRAEHLKRQRDALVEKKNRERQEQLSTFQQTSGPTAAARVAEGVLARQPIAGPTDAGLRLTQELSGQAPPPDPGTEQAAQDTAATEMRKMLNKQLRATFMR